MELSPDLLHYPHYEDSLISISSMDTWIRVLQNSLNNLGSFEYGR